jgi:ferrochelatase
VTKTVPHLVLVNLGTPQAPTAPAVREFLAEFLSDPSVVDLPRWLWVPILKGIILRTRPARVAHQYSAIWTAEGSPLRVATERIVDRLRAQAEGRFGVSAAYRYGEPSLDATMKRLAQDHTGPVVVVPLFPQRTDPTTGTAFSRAREAAARAGVAHRLMERPIDAADPGYVAALAARWTDTVATDPVPLDHVVVSFHGIPARFNRREREMYSRDCEATAQAFLAAIAWPADRATLAYQSKFGPERWLTPATADVLAELPRRGVRSVGVIAPGFVTDGLETVEELGIRGRETFLAAGGERFVLIRAVEDHPSFIDALVGLALGEL